MSEQEAVSATSWYVRCCRRLWPILLYMWPLLAGIFVSTIANLNTTTTDTPLSQLFIIHLALVFPIPFFSSFGLLIILTVVCGIGKGNPGVSGPIPLPKQKRVRFLTKLSTEYTDLLEHSLQGVNEISLTSHSMPDVVHNTARIRFRLHRASLSEQTVPDGTSLAQLYDQASGELLILGGPGSGKTTLMLQLAIVLQRHAIQDESAPIPVMVNLSTWANTRPPLQDWLVEEIARTYQVPRASLTQWVQEDQILPLLDGLDEMEESARVACILAINTYHSQHLGPLVVCSREHEYKKVARRIRLRLHNAIILQPLTTAQVDAYLEQGGKPLAALRTLLKKKHEWQDLATTPLMLNVLVKAYQGTSAHTSSARRSQLQQQVFTDYVQRVAGNEERYALQSTCAWLGWLAHQMREHHQTIFFLEDLQMDWLPNREQALYRRSVRFINGLIGLVLGIIVNLVIGGILNGVIGGLVWGLSFLWLFGRDLRIKPREAVGWSPEGVRAGFVFGLGFGVLFKFVFGLVLRVMSPLAFFLTAPAFAYWGMLVCGLSDKQFPKHDHRTPNEGIRRSVRLGLLTALLVSSLPGLISGLVIGPINGLALGVFGIVFLGLRDGLQAALRHYILRFYLWQAHLFPWHAVRFLDDARSRMLLQRVGGGYSFVHGLLLDYFEDTFINEKP